MTMTILIQLPGQIVPRPLNRASSIGELQELIADWGQRLYGDDLEGDIANIDTETPLLTYPHKGQGLAKIWAFTEGKV